MMADTEGAGSLNQVVMWVRWEGSEWVWAWAGTGCGGGGEMR